MQVDCKGMSINNRKFHDESANQESKLQEPVILA